MKIAYVLRQFPSHSETFILRELLALRELGADLAVFSLEPPDPLIHAEARPLLDRVHYLHDRSPADVVSADVAAARRLALRRAPLDPRLLVSCLRAAPCAAALARLARQAGIAHIHAHFAFAPADVAALAAGVIGTPFSVSVHARDIYTQSAARLRRRLAGAAFVAACTEHGRRRVQQALTSDATVVLARHGVRLDPDPPTLDLTSRLVLGVGRLVPKKGFHVLVEALALARREDATIRGALVGDGPLRDELSRKIDALGLASAVTLTGALTQEEVRTWYARAAVLVVPSIQADDGDRDGLPNVVLEAMGMGLPVVATTASAADEAIEDGVNGCLLPPGDAPALARRLLDLLADPAERGRMGERARATVKERFDLSRNVGELWRLFSPQQETLRS